MSASSYSFLSEFSTLQSGYKQTVRYTFDKLLKVFFEAFWLVNESVATLSRREEGMYARTEANIRDFLSASEQRSQDLLIGIQRASERLIALSLLESGPKNRLDYFKSADFFREVNLKEIFSIAKGQPISFKDIASFNNTSSSEKSAQGHRLEFEDAKAAGKLDLSHSEALDNYNVRTLSLYHSEQEYGNFLEKEYLVKDSLETVKNNKPDEDMQPNIYTFDKREAFNKPNIPAIHLLQPHRRISSLRASVRAESSEQALHPQNLFFDERTDRSVSEEREQLRARSELFAKSTTKILFPKKSASYYRANQPPS